MAQRLIKFFEKLEEKKMSEENLGDTIRREHRLRKANKTHPENCLKARFISQEDFYQIQKPKKINFSSEENLEILRSTNEYVDEQHVKVNDNDEEYATNSREIQNFDQKYSSEDENSSLEDQDSNLKPEKETEKTEFISESEPSSEGNFYEFKNENLEREFHDQQNSFEGEIFFNEDYKEETVSNPLEDIERELLDNISKLHELNLEDTSLQMKRIEISLMIHKAIDSISKNCDRDELKEFYVLILEIRNKSQEQEQVQEMKLILVKIDNIVINLKKENSSTNQKFISNISQNVKHFLEQHLLKREDTALFFKNVRVTDEQIDDLCNYYEKSVRVIE